MVGLLTDKSEIPAISADLESAGVDVAAVEILCGEQGARILDQDGRYHGLQARMVRALQRFGYDGRSRPATRSARRIRQPLSPLTPMAASNLDRKVVAPAMAEGPGNLSRRVARQHHELGLTREQVAYCAGMAASGLPLLSHALREPAAMSLSFKPGELQTHAPGLDWTNGVVVTGDCRRGQTVQPAVMAIGRLISAVPGSYIRVRYLTVSAWWPR